MAGQKRKREDNDNRDVKRQKVGLGTFTHNALVMHLISKGVAEINVGDIEKNVDWLISAFIDGLLGNVKCFPVIARKLLIDMRELGIRDLGHGSYVALFERPSVVSRRGVEVPPREENYLWLKYPELVSQFVPLLTESQKSELDYTLEYEKQEYGTEIPSVYVPFMITEEE